MRKIGLFLGALLVSFSCYAGSTSVADDVKSAFVNNSAHSGQDKFSIIYGGQDFSKSVIATANESLWKGQTSLVG